MCTVTFLNNNGKYIITSNRDEKVLRPKAIEPKNYVINQKNVFFPKDSKAGGTWYAVDENANVIVLLNGAREKHIRKESYKKSRGLIVLDLIGATFIIKTWNKIDLDNIEPFTLIVFENLELFQLRWDGEKKETLQLDETKNHIWSSSTLYPKEIRESRAKWFYQFLGSKTTVSDAEILHFHRYTEEDNKENGLIINRNDILKTLSITQSVIEKNKVILNHLDLIHNEQFTNSFIVI
ncbi:NRDE family protein [Flavobacterium sp.]|uniref:NRDE family protein n=1 Tax=Flavobacterium sp. TaxID=239 RepID=UPI002610CB3D|nr:NRDE family protein [Flavobacterium sp.]